MNFQTVAPKKGMGLPSASVENETTGASHSPSLIAAQGGPVASTDEALTVFIRAIPWNLYPILMLATALAVAVGLLPDIGPMRGAERRATETGQVIRPGARPLAGAEQQASLADAALTGTPSLLAELVVPVALLVGYGAWTLISAGSVQIVEAFLLANTYLILFGLWKETGSSTSSGEYME